MTPQEIKLSVRVLVYLEDGNWIGQCLEYDISCQAKSMHDLRKRIMKSIAANMAIADSLEKKLSDIGPAPDKFWKMFNESQEEFKNNSFPMRGPEINPTLRLADTARCA